MNTETVWARLSAAAEGLAYDDGPHTYHGPSGAELRTSSRVAEAFTRPFDEAYWSRRKAEERGVDASVVLGEWRAKNLRSRLLGSAVHAFAEAYLSLLPCGGVPPRDWDAFTAALQACHDHDPALGDEVRARCDALQRLFAGPLAGWEVVALEVRTYSEALGVAGTFDALLRDPRGRLWVFDWKTNGRFRTPDDRCFGRLLAPFGHLPECELSKYSVQLSLYRLLLAEAGVETRGAVAAWLPPGGGDAVLHRAFDLTDQLREVLPL